MQKRIKLQKLFILVFAVIISILLISLLLGRNDLVKVYVVNSDKIDTSRPLMEQQDQLATINVSKKDLGGLVNNIVVSPTQFSHNEKLAIPLKKGSMILTDLLTTSKDAGQFASQTPIYHTIYALPDGKTSLPPGVEQGDRIDINLIYSKDGKVVEGLLLHDVKIQSIVDNTLYLSVSQTDYSKLTISQQLGTFSLQLPGQKIVPLCSVAKQKLEKDKATQLAKIDADKKMPTSAKDAQKQSIEQEYQNLEQNAECYNPSDKPQQVNSQDILNEVFNNSQNGGVDPNASSSIDETTTDSSSNNGNSNSSTQSDSNIQPPTNEDGATVISTTTYPNPNQNGSAKK